MEMPTWRDDCTDLCRNSADSLSLALSSLCGGFGTATSDAAGQMIDEKRGMLHFLTESMALVGTAFAARKTIQPFAHFRAQRGSFAPADFLLCPL